MKIWILSSHTAQKTVDSTSLLLAAARKSKISIQIYSPEDLHFEISSKKLSLFCQSKKLRLPDLVLPRFGWKTLDYGLRLCRFFESAQVPVINPADSLEKASDKLTSLLVFKKNLLPIPETRFALSGLDTAHHILPGNRPQIFKLLRGSQGFGVTLHENSSQAKAQAEAYRSVPVEFIGQEYISESHGEDIRAFVIGGRVIAAMKRSAPAGDFRSNLHQGGSAEPISLTKTEEKLAIRAAKSLGLFYSGVDLLRSKNGPLLIEANPFPGLDGISLVTGTPVAEILLEKLRKQV